MSQPNPQGKPRATTPTDAEKAAKKAERQEANRKRFLELAPKRTNTALSAIRRISNTANRNGYSYSDEEAEKIVSALEEAVKSVRQAFSSTAAKADSFTL